MRSMLLAVLLALWGAAAHAQTQTLVDVATISMSAPGVPRTVTNTVCATDGNDLVCDRQMYVYPDAKIGIGLRPSSTTANGAAILTVATDGPSSSSSLGNAAIEVESKNRNSSLIISNPYGATGQVILRNGGLETISGQSSIAYQNGVLRLFVSSSVPALMVTSDSQVGIGMSFLGIPQTRLQVSGTLRLGSGGEACDANRTGAIRFTGGDFSFCRNGSAWETLTSLAGGGGLSDRITSGTASGVVAMAGGTISFTTGGTSGTAYLDTLGRFIGAGVSTTGAVSAASIYAGSSLQLASPTAVTACTSTAAGTIRYNSPTTTLELCTGSGWQPMGVGIPAGTISAFASTTCPTGWSEYTAARGRFLRGIDNGAGNDADGTRAPGAAQADALQDHYHSMETGTNASVGSGSDGYARSSSGVSNGGFATARLSENVTRSFGNLGAVNANTIRWSAETRPKNVAVTFCQFNGTSNGWNNPLSGGSTSAAGNTGQVQYNTSGAFDASPDFSWSNGSKVLGVNGGISTTKTISTTDVYMAKSGGQCSTADDIGRMFRSATTGKLQICADRN